jgi:rod shape-determining protein MreD
MSTAHRIPQAAGSSATVGGRSWKEIMPLVSVVLVTLLAALPWGLPSEARFLLPLLPYAAIHFWAVRRPELMPEWLIFLSGLATDVLSHGPLGFWSLVFLLGYFLVQVLRGLTRWGAMGRWLQFCATITLLALVQWILASLYFMSASDWKPLVRSALWVCLLYPLLGLLFRPLTRLWPHPVDSRIERGA